MNYITGRRGNRVAILPVGLLMGALLSSAGAQEKVVVPPTATNAKTEVADDLVSQAQLVAELEKAILAGDKALALIKKAGKSDDESVPVIGKFLQQQQELRDGLLDKLANNPRASYLLVQLAADDLERETINVLTRRDPPFKLEEDIDPIHLFLFGQYVQNSTGRDAGKTAMLLANVKGYFSLCFPPILARFKREVEYPTTDYLSGLGHETPPYYVTLNLFLLAFSQFEDTQEVIAALQKESQGKVSPKLRQWLTVAQGFAGDKSVAAQLQTYLEPNYKEKQAEDVLRPLILSAYARSAQQEAIPTLEKYLDATHTMFGPDLPYVAREELNRLRNVAPTTGVMVRQ
ncbi:hypothetical protein EON83_26725 [bacterium]|nr:MAG: hypothetical protein EON83_26725 [bacterium]